MTALMIISSLLAGRWAAMAGPRWSIFAGCLLFGAEGPGLTAVALAACDDMVEIPMPSHMNSLNVAAATAVFLYEATRQRG